MMVGSVFSSREAFHMRLTAVIGFSFAVGLALILMPIASDGIRHFASTYVEPKDGSISRHWLSAEFDIRISGILLTMLVSLATLLGFTLKPAKGENRGFPFGRAVSPFWSMACCLAFALGLTIASDSICGIAERSLGTQRYVYAPSGRIAVFCMGLFASASCLVANAMAIDLSHVQADAKWFGPSMPKRFNVWMLVVALSLVTFPGVAFALASYLPIHGGPKSALDTMIVGDPFYPYEVPFSWIGLNLGLGRYHTYALSVGTSLLVTWGACRLTAAVHRSLALPPPPHCSAPSEEAQTATVSV